MSKGGENARFLEKYWPLLAYASCNFPGESLGGSITQKEIMEKSSEIGNTTHFNNLLHRAKKAGYIQKKNPGDWRITEKGEELVEDGLEFDEKNVLYQEMAEEQRKQLFENLKDRITENELQKFWPTLAHAYTDIGTDSILPYNIDDIISEAEKRKYIEKVEEGNYEITSRGEELLQKGFNFNEDNITYETCKDWDKLIREIKERTSNSIDFSELDQFLENEDRVFLDRLSKELEIPRGIIQDHVESRTRYKIEVLSGAKYVEIQGSSDIRKSSKDHSEVGEKITVQEATFGNGIVSNRSTRNKIKDRYNEQINEMERRLDGPYTFNQLAAELDITPKKSKTNFYNTS